MKVINLNMLNIWKEKLNFQKLTQSNYLTIVKSICQKYSETRNEISEIGINPFLISSDLYYRENFHSDIIKTLLDPNGQHQEKNLYLNFFIDLLNSYSSYIRIDKKNYINAKVTREQHSIDIFIFDEISKKAIIIENKINNARDMPRQLPRYYHKVKNKYTIDAIVYITLNSSKRPDIYDWTKEELLEINAILMLIPSYHNGGINNLYSNWLLPCLIKTKNIDSFNLIKQYSELVKYLNTNYMDTVSLENFYNTLKNNDNLKTSISIRNMLNDLPEYLAIRIEDKYKDNCYPFKKIWRHKQIDTVFEAFEMGNIYLKMDIWCSENGYSVYFWNPNNENYDIKNDFLNTDLLFGFEYIEDKINKMKRNFNFWDEEELFQFIDGLIDELKNRKNNHNI